MAMSPNQDYVLKTINERGVGFIRLWFTDVLGNLKSLAITPHEVIRAFEDGIGFDGSSVDGFAQVEVSDMLAIPDASTFQILPWRPSTDSVARMFCSVHEPGGAHFSGDPRHVLALMTRKAEDMGYTAMFGPELEYYCFKGTDLTEPLDNGGYFDHTSRDPGSDLRRDTVLALERMGITVQYSHHEAGPSQHEVHLQYAEALSMADNVMTCRDTVKEVALGHDVHATFMPKPFTEYSGNGMHVFQTLYDENGNNLFGDKDDPDGLNLSAVAKHYIAGLLKYAPEYCLITNQYVNSYKRLMPGTDAPSYICWGNRNRSAMVRIPRYWPEADEFSRIEVRTPDSAANPYLAFAAMLGAGLKGIEDGLELIPEADGVDVAKLSAAEREERGIKRLPATLGEAIDCFEQSELMREVLGEHIHGWLVNNKREEWEEYCSCVTPWELDRYLKTI